MKGKKSDLRYENRIEESEKMNVCEELEEKVRVVVKKERVYMYYIQNQKAIVTLKP